MALFFIKNIFLKKKIADHIQDFISGHNNSDYILNGILFNWVLLNVNSIQKKQFQEKSQFWVLNVIEHALKGHLCPVSQT